MALYKLYLSVNGNDSNVYLVKAYDRPKLEGTNNNVLLKNEVIINVKISHKNIIRYIGFKKTKKHLFIIFEYYNGRNLSKILEKYQQNYGKRFSQEIIQYIMK